MGMKYRAMPSLLAAVLMLSPLQHTPAVAGVGQLTLVCGGVATVAHVGDNSPVLRLRGGKSGRRTKPAKVPKQFWTKRYQADWDKLKMSKRVHDPERGLSTTEHVKLPGSYWAFGRTLPDRAPNMTVGRDIPYEKAYLKSGAMLFHPG